MTKACKVILNNDAVTVVKFGTKEIQFPSIHKDTDSVFVKADNGMYSIVDKMENEAPTTSTSKKVENKKSTSEKVTENTNKKFDSADKE